MTLSKIKIGDQVIYVSRSGKKYVATVTGIPENPWHAYTPLPTVSLSFRNERNKLVRKTRVIPADDIFTTRVYLKR